MRKLRRKASHPLPDHCPIRRLTQGSAVVFFCLFRNVGPPMSRQLPYGRLFVLSCFLTVPGPEDGLWRPKTSRNQPVAIVVALPGPEGR